MTSLVADYGTSSGSESERDVRSDDDDDDEDADADDGNTFKDEEAEEAEEAEEDGRNDTDDYERREKARADGGLAEADDDSKIPLPRPNFASAPGPKTSVFTNPFVEAEKAKSAILEKHVKMTPTLDDTKMINGRKICWNYRKGRCRFGHNCTFAHDSDLHRSAAELEASRTPEETLICQTRYAGQTRTSVVNGGGGGGGGGGGVGVGVVVVNGDCDEDEQEIDQENNQLQKRKKRPGLAQNLVPGKKVLKLYKAQQAKTIGR